MTERVNMDEVGEIACAAYAGNPNRDPQTDVRYLLGMFDKLREQADRDGYRRGYVDADNGKDPEEGMLDE